MSEFESACWDWYCDVVSPHTVQAGIVAEEYKALGLGGIARVLFLRAFRKIAKMADETAAAEAKR